MSGDQHGHQHVEARAHGEPREVPRRPGMYERSLVGPEDGVTELFVNEVTFTQGAEIPLHHHTVVEAWVVLDGALIDYDVPYSVEGLRHLVHPWPYKFS